MNDDFLLRTKTAQHLYHEYAENMPIIDYHSHLSPQELAENKKFDNLTQLWLYGDHYKWRAMRANGIAERYCSGDANDYEKFLKWAETVPKIIRNPLYHWTHLELKKYFGIDILLSKSTAKEIYESTREMLQSDDFDVYGLLRKSNVEVLCTTDDPIDNLEFHKAILKNRKNFNVKVLPVWRPDKALSVENAIDFNDYLFRLSETTGNEIHDFATFIKALKERHDFFGIYGCKLSDHGLGDFPDEQYTNSEIHSIFTKIKEGKNLSIKEVAKFKTAMLYELAVMDNQKDWVQQFHLGTIRNTNLKMLKNLGHGTGYDSIGDYSFALPLASFLDRLNRKNALTKTILYNLNPKDNAVFATMIGNFQDGKTPGKIQWGSAWWFNDQKEGITQQLNMLSNMGLLSRFIGMLTDSRSLLSFSRHEYFRRILCDLLGDDVEQGLIPNDINLLGNMVKDICYFNAKNYFNF